MIEAGTRMLRGIGHDLRTALTPLKLRMERMGESGQKDGLLSDIDRIESLLVENLNYPRNDYATETVELVDVAGILQTACSEFAVSVTSSDTPSQTGFLPEAGHFPLHGSQILRQRR
ncbi:hypothetical protein [Rhizobium laguerreae]|uniref:hypothetical protein n=1 Tax=Rhizobium laguerreae TaxID=1076926 RepID=UPI001C90AAC4|nr:hypothetical protein [Rhizobium laguerreae]MBY3369089.1 hypothetical protein [Rhizobium laguerreae]MBY3389693.1 hypothetical protein [Rhizobium laguerreae]MBY3403444.1 hypothetical protein [Rhizobium laguerreae]MBY3410383.1 hypothetical protein [Rhizobium laguerreae]MBY3515562.1 hypothetical protein [Rhizobium laguerreae]